MPKGFYVRKVPPKPPVNVPRSIEERFWPKVNKTEGCWLWTAAHDTKGYGKIQVGTMKEPQLRSAHRVSWELAYGPIPEGMGVLHHCDNPPCVKPEHLFLGNHQANHNDKWAKGRGLKGDTSPARKLSSEKVIEIRTASLSGENRTSLAGRFDVSKSTVDNILNNKNWRNLGPAQEAADKTRAGVLTKAMKDELDGLAPLFREGLIKVSVLARKFGVSDWTVQRYYRSTADVSASD